MDFPQALEWYTHLASQPGWKEYVWHRVNEMAKDAPELFGQLPAALSAEMKRRSADAEPQ